MSADAWLKATLLAGLAAAMAVAGWMIRRGGGPSEWMFWLIWPAMAVHQCEENVFTELVLGKPGRFTNWVRTVGYDISPWRAIGLNAGIGWTMAIAAGLVGEHLPAVGLFVVIVEAINGMWHLSVTSLTRRWSPGTLSGVLIAVPLAMFLAHRCWEEQAVSAVTLFILYLLACASHHSFLQSLPRVNA